jgi:hypothetical protein
MMGGRFPPPPPTLIGESPSTRRLFAGFFAAIVVAPYQVKTMVNCSQFRKQIRIGRGKPRKPIRVRATCKALCRTIALAHYRAPCSKA